MPRPKKKLSTSSILSCKKGGTMVEAAVVLPLIMLSVMAVIYILSFMYNETATNTLMHLKLNEKMGTETGTVKSYKNVPQNITVYEGTYNFKRVFLSEKDIKFRRSGLLQNSFSKKKESRVFSVDEKKYIRYSDFFK